MNDLSNIDFKVINLLSAEQAHKFRVIPCAHTAEEVVVFHPGQVAPSNKAVEFLLGKPVRYVSLSPDEFERGLARYYPSSTVNARRDQAELREDSDVIRFVRTITEEAAALGASDIHIERYESFARVRFRWEGQLIERYEVPLSQYNAVVSRIKIMSELDISERRLPQDGRIHLDVQGKKIDIRVSTLPSRFGEKVVLRLLTRSASFLALDNLGMHSEELARFRHALQAPDGIILITGPTGSGKTTTLYAALSLLNRPNVNISTIEDPVEYNIEGINQVQVKEEIGMTFGHALRAFLRQDPNIIMVGEIRDGETAEIAIRAALAGRLVMSTLHTNSSWDAVTRLMDMGVESYLLGATMRLVVAQRLLRRLCHSCKQPGEMGLNRSLLDRHGIAAHWVASGCPQCHYTGYTQRRAVYEVLPIDKALVATIRAGEVAAEAYMARMGVRSLQQQVVELIVKGETSLEEGLSYLV